MFAFLQKKIAVPAQATAFSCGWDHYEGWLAIGASDGFLKLIRLEDVRDKNKQGSENADLNKLKIEIASYQNEEAIWKIDKNILNKLASLPINL